MNKTFLTVLVFCVVLVSCAPSSNSLVLGNNEVLYRALNAPSSENRSNSFTQEVAVILIDYLVNANVVGFDKPKYQAGESLITHSYARLVFNARASNTPNAGIIRSVWILRDRGGYYFTLLAYTTASTDISSKLQKLETDALGYIATIFERVSGNR